MGFLKTLAGLLLIFFGLSGLVSMIPRVATNVAVDTISPFAILGITAPTLNDVMLDSVMFFGLLFVGGIIVFHRKDRHKK
jgi:hypothetical protein